MILCEVRRREQFVFDKKMTVCSLIGRMCKQNVELFGNPGLLIEHSFSGRVRACIFSIGLLPVSYNIRLFKTLLLIFILSVLLWKQQ